MKPTSHLRVFNPPLNLILRHGASSSQQPLGRVIPLDVQLQLQRQRQPQRKVVEGWVPGVEGLEEKKGQGQGQAMGQVMGQRLEKGRGQEHRLGQRLEQKLEKGQELGHKPEKLGQEMEMEIEREKRLEMAKWLDMGQVMGQRLGQEQRLGQKLEQVKVDVDMKVNGAGQQQRQQQHQQQQIAWDTKVNTIGLHSTKQKGHRQQYGGYRQQQQQRGYHQLAVGREEYRHQHQQYQQQQQYQQHQQQQVRQIQGQQHQQHQQHQRQQRQQRQQAILARTHPLLMDQDPSTVSDMPAAQEEVQNGDNGLNGTEQGQKPRNRKTVLEEPKVADFGLAEVSNSGGGVGGSVEGAEGTGGVRIRRLESREGSKNRGSILAHMGGWAAVRRNRAAGAGGSGSGSGRVKNQQSEQTQQDEQSQQVQQVQRVQQVQQVQRVQQAQHVQQSQKNQQDQKNQQAQQVQRTQQTQENNGLKDGGDGKVKSEKKAEPMGTVEKKVPSYFTFSLKKGRKFGPSALEHQEDLGGWKVGNDMIINGGSVVLRSLGLSSPGVAETTAETRTREARKAEPKTKTTSASSQAKAATSTKQPQQQQKPPPPLTTHRLTLIPHANSSDIFSPAPPPGSLLIHACNAQGDWGTGIARIFRTHYPGAYKAYQAHCSSIPITSTSTSSQTNNLLQDQEEAAESVDPIQARKNALAKHQRSLVGTALLIPPRPSVPDDKKHFVGCLFTSLGYGPYRDPAVAMMKATGKAMEDLMRQVAEWNVNVNVNATATKKKKSMNMVIGPEMRMPRIDAGKSAVEWEMTKEVLEKVEVRVPEGMLPGKGEIMVFEGVSAIEGEKGKGGKGKGKGKGQRNGNGK
ncbi:ADP-ribose 1''-phosphate phosphatase, variant [Neurospora crassa OR74A]|uniref:ADP-ribose 1''-phosphate phosphatase, variant n=1 Tax=Neurospora crassa (strain ATCC 24698 / 74-OR23-1A / CBS 708.71 / DSM 1257 / FGSC 987) TaxID=367110 RepID=V5IMZ4_NEUCR|nr:ADP-ribose 1''-phosphate phosphatase, variant [Neurospora crassa OR74A]ESA43498.1 ADP-ribose 1''-phosphate phosphatase, variant [Neurospora crassa OR74A]|eukprot:XP_011393671.1 ADP-ribose 1''-phosphate phosphatase, variant [Neurospora crassa OR74A]